MVLGAVVVVMGVLIYWDGLWVVVVVVGYRW